MTASMDSDNKPSRSSDEDKNLSPSPSKGYGDEASSVAAGHTFEGYIVDKAMEKKMLRKFDLVILPTVALMYLFKCAQNIQFSARCSD